MSQTSSSLPTALQQLASAQDFARVAEVVRTVARDLVGSDGVTFVIRDHDRCYYAEEDAIAPLWKGQRFPMSLCVSGWVMMRGASLVIPDVYDDPRVLVEAYRSTFVKSMAMAPVGRRQPVAAIGAYWATYHVATQAEVEILQALGDSAALALIGDAER